MELFYLRQLADNHTIEGIAPAIFRDSAGCNILFRQNSAVFFLFFCYPAIVCFQTLHS